MMTPGTYLRKRREAAGLGVIQVAATLAIYSMMPRSTNPRAVIVQRLNRAEEDLEPLNRAQLGLLRTAGFSLDIDVYLQLVDLHADPANPDLPRPAVCRECACSWNDACLVNGRGCCWVEQPNPARDGLCTRCLHLNSARPAPVLTQGLPA
jgi:hypothetical protein